MNKEILEKWWDERTLPDKPLLLYKHEVASLLSQALQKRDLEWKQLAYKELVPDWNGETLPEGNIKNFIRAILNSKY